MERRGEKSLLNAINTELHWNLEDWKESPYSDIYANRLQVLLDLVKRGDLGLTLKIKQEALENEDDRIRILPQELKVLFIKHWPEDDCEVFAIAPFSEQNEGGRDPYILVAHADAGLCDSYLTIYQLNHGGVAYFLPSDIESIEAC